jgi:hypothetical protein
MLLQHLLKLLNMKSQSSNKIHLFHNLSQSIVITPLSKAKWTKLLNEEHKLLKSTPKPKGITNQTTPLHQLHLERKQQPKINPSSPKL